MSYGNSRSFSGRRLSLATATILIWSREHCELSASRPSRPVHPRLHLFILFSKFSLPWPESPWEGAAVGTVDSSSSSRSLSESLAWDAWKMAHCDTSVSNVSSSGATDASACEYVASSVLESDASILGGLLTSICDTKSFRAARSG